MSAPLFLGLCNLSSQTSVTKERALTSFTHRSEVRPRLQACARVLLGFGLGLRLGSRCFHFQLSAGSWHWGADTSAAAGILAVRSFVRMRFKLWLLVPLGLTFSAFGLMDVVGLFWRFVENGGLTIVPFCSKERGSRACAVGISSSKRQIDPARPPDPKPVVRVEQPYFPDAHLQSHRLPKCLNPLKPLPLTQKTLDPWRGQEQENDNSQMAEPLRASRQLGALRGFWRMGFPG